MIYNKQANISSQYEPATVDTAKSITRGGEGRGFDESIGLTVNQIKQLAKEMIAQGGKP